MEPGHKLAQYRIAGRIGAGGRGEVFAASDTNLDRDVAIKVLPRDPAGVVNVDRVQVSADGKA